MKERKVANVLIIDDNKEMCNMLARMVERMDHNATCAHTIKDGLKEVTSKAFDVVFLDVRLPDGNGLEILPKIRETSSSPEVIIITGAGDPDGAEIAVKNGAWDYLEKPISLKKTILSLNRVFQHRNEIKKLQKPAVIVKLKGVIGKSPLMKACFDSLAQAAVSNANVLITGKTGTGKELFAKGIHYNSSRAKYNFVVVDCAALPESLIESSLFGHEKGAFTGATMSRDGLIKQADRGTLFLDEVGELTPPLQKAFLRVLQEHRFRPIGGKHEVESDFRLVAATNRDLDQLVRQGRFRKDLLFRLRSLTIEVPSLKERLEDISDLVMYYMTKICTKNEIVPKGISPEFLEALTKYEWPGNIRELINTLENAISVALHEPTLYSNHLPTYIRVYLARTSVQKKSPSLDSSVTVEDSLEILPSLKEFRIATYAEAEKQYFQKLLKITNSNIKEACSISGLSRSRLYELLKKHNISVS